MARVVNLTLYFVALLLFYRFMRFFFSGAWSLFAVFLLATCPPVFFMSVMVKTEMMQLVEELQAIVGKAAVITDPQDAAPYTTDWRKRYFGKPLAVVKPASTAEVAAVMQLCAQTRTPIVPQGGNTSLCGASVPLSCGRQIVLNLSRMNRIRAVDPTDYTMTVEAGCTLASVREAAEQQDRLFPLGLTAEAAALGTTAGFGLWNPASVAMIDDPPELMSGSVSPFTGSRPADIVTLYITWNVNADRMPTTR